MTTQKREWCLMCGSEKFTDILNLGNLHLNAFPLPHEGDSLKSPLAVVHCSGCNLLQLGHRTNPDLLYRTYWYRSGTNQTMRDALRDVALAAEERGLLEPGDTVVDIGSNDNTLLNRYTVEGLRKFGFEPSNIGAEAKLQEGVTIVNDYFDTIPALCSNAKVVTSIAMFYGLEDPVSFIEAVKYTLRPGGLWINQLAYLPSILDRNAFDGICHEHVAYYSLHNLVQLLHTCHMIVEDVELVDLNEGSIRLYIRKESPGIKQSRRVRELLECEKAQGLDSIDPYRAFADRVFGIREAVGRFFEHAHRNGKKVHGYGASTKGNTMLQFFGLSNTDVSAIWERQKQKWGRETVGTRIPIISEEQGRRLMPDYLFVLPWHFSKEFVEREREYLDRGGQIVIPLPDFRIVRGTP